MRKLTVAVLTAFALALPASAAFAGGPPEGAGGPAQDECEDLKGNVNKNPGGSDDCSY